MLTSLKAEKQQLQIQFGILLVIIDNMKGIIHLMRQEAKVINSGPRSESLALPLGSSAFYRPQCQLLAGHFSA